MILTLDEAKTQLRLELDFTAHDEMLSSLINAAQRSIERTYYCRLVESQEQLAALVMVKMATLLMTILSWQRK